MKPRNLSKRQLFPKWKQFEPVQSVDEHRNAAMLRFLADMRAVDEEMRNGGKTYSEGELLASLGLTDRNSVLGEFHETLKMELKVRRSIAREVMNTSESSKPAEA